MQYQGLHPKLNVWQWHQTACEVTWILDLLNVLEVIDLKACLSICENLQIAADPIYQERAKHIKSVLSSWYIWKGLRPSYGTPRINPGCVLWGEFRVPSLLVVQEKKNKKTHKIDRHFIREEIEHTVIRTSIQRLISNL